VFDSYFYLTNKSNLSLTGFNTIFRSFGSGLLFWATLYIHTAMMTSQIRSHVEYLIHT